MLLINNINPDLSKILNYLGENGLIYNKLNYLFQTQIDGLLIKHALFFSI